MLSAPGAKPETQSEVSVSLAVASVARICAKQRLQKLLSGGFRASQRGQARYANPANELPHFWHALASSGLRCWQPGQTIIRFRLGVGPLDADQDT